MTELGLVRHYDILLNSRCVTFYLHLDKKGGVKSDGLYPRELCLHILGFLIS